MKPLVLTTGEPAGVAPEITARAWLALNNEQLQPFCLIGDAAVFENRANAAGIDVAFIGVERVADCSSVFLRGVPVLHRALPVSSAAGQLDVHNSGRLCGNQNGSRRFGDKKGRAYIGHGREKSSWRAGWRTPRAARP